MSETFKGQTYAAGTVEGDSLRREMDNKVLDLICERYSIKGLRAYLQGLFEVDPGQREENSYEDH
jgi:hypothetical protein